MEPLYIATRPFDASDGTRWDDYIRWSKLTQLTEVVTLDQMLCPTLLPKIHDSYWPHIVNEDFMLNFFVDMNFLLSQIGQFSRKNLLCLFRNPAHSHDELRVASDFEFIGYDLVDLQSLTSALTNCGGFTGAFDNAELSSKGLIDSFSRAREIQAALRREFPGEPHAHCHLWAIFRHAG